MFAHLCLEDLGRCSTFLARDIETKFLDKTKVGCINSKLNPAKLEVNENLKCSVVNDWKNTELITARITCFGLGVIVLVIARRHQIRWCFMHPQCSVLQTNVERKICSRKAFRTKEDLAKHQRKRAGGSTFGLQSVIILEKKDSKKVRKRETWNII